MFPCFIIPAFSVAPLFLRRLLLLVSCAPKPPIPGNDVSRGLQRGRRVQRHGGESSRRISDDDKLLHARVCSHLFAVSNGARITGYLGQLQDGSWDSSTTRMLTTSRSSFK